MTTILNSSFSATPLAIFFKNYSSEVRISSSAIQDVIFPAVGVSVTFISLKNENLLAPEYARLNKISKLHIKVCLTKLLTLQFISKRNYIVVLIDPSMANLSSQLRALEGTKSNSRRS